MPGDGEFIPGVGYAGTLSSDVVTNGGGRCCETGKCAPKKISKSMTASVIGIAVTVIGESKQCVSYIFSKHLHKSSGVYEMGST